MHQAAFKVAVCPLPPKLLYNCKGSMYGMLTPCHVIGKTVYINLFISSIETKITMLLLL